MAQLVPLVVLSSTVLYSHMAITNKFTLSHEIYLLAQGPYKQFDCIRGLQVHLGLSGNKYGYVRLPK